MAVQLNQSIASVLLSAPPSPNGVALRQATASITMEAPPMPPGVALRIMTYAVTLAAPAAPLPTLRYITQADAFQYDSLYQRIIQIGTVGGIQWARGLGVELTEKSAGRWYWETIAGPLSAGRQTGAGIQPLNTTGTEPGQDAAAWFLVQDGSRTNNGTTSASVVEPWSEGDRIAHRLDLDNGTYAVENLTAGAQGVTTVTTSLTAGTYIPMIAARDLGEATLKLADVDMIGTVPPGFQTFIAETVALVLPKLLSPIIT